MSYSRTDYFAECLSESFEEHGVTATKEQILAIAKDVADITESAGQAFYQPEHPVISEAEILARELRREKSKIACRPCAGSGVLVHQGPHHGSTSTCYKCNGEGRHLP